MARHSHAARIPSSGRNGSALLVEALPQPPSDSRIRARLLSAYGAAARPFEDALYMRKEEDTGSLPSQIFLLRCSW